MVTTTVIIMNIYGNGGDHFDGSEEQDCGDRKE